MSLTESASMLDAGDPSDTAMRWRLTREVLQWRNWGDESLVFDPRSGDTHFLDNVAREGLLCLQDGPGTLAEIHQRLATRLEIEPEEQLQEYARLLMDRFLESGLVEFVS